MAFVLFRFDSRLRDLLRLDGAGILFDTGRFHDRIRMVESRTLGACSKIILGGHSFGCVSACGNAGALALGERAPSYAYRLGSIDQAIWFQSCHFGLTLRISSQPSCPDRRHVNLYNQRTKVTFKNVRDLLYAAD